MRYLAPGDLQIGHNARKHVDTDAPQFRSLVASIIQHVALQAISAVEGADGVVLVRDGQHRTLASREAGLTTIPVLVRPETGDEKTAAIARITEQLSSNDHRIDITESDRASAITDMLDLGMSAAAITRELKYTKAYVETAARAVDRRPRSATSMTSL
ncbi:ParB N-terminal domain-containing protein [Rhodococcus sp. H29-C3]|uniref:ParB/RepB/Spo0J family partition protein n=1 Tax=Rhodococcus sp. H29-C3 TaxID=3046307 RepID=UPI0024B87F2F|nr:ParB N-terminal domain-containing protein [Rhodococcus sp. H29-C3]MDJ0363125.1 ParB N-terminal domain-containing protein [Rhodococcus sp. H29-C3]